MTLNLLAWREATAKQKILVDLLLTCFYAGLCALVMELGLMVLSLSQSYFVWQKSFIAQKMLQIKDDYQKANEVNQHLTELKQKTAELEKQQAQWQKISLVIQAAEVAKAKDILLTSITLDEGKWQIKGQAKNFALVENYQQSLAKSFKYVDIAVWHPTTTQNLLGNFTFELKR
jgi:hypothetical protein